MKNTKNMFLAVILLLSIGMMHAGKADLSNADLIGAYLKYADLSNADLSNAYLKYADLSNADLSNADLSNAYLKYAELSNADLSNADFSGNENTIIISLVGGVKIGMPSIYNICIAACAFCVGFVIADVILEDVATDTSLNLKDHCFYDL